MLYDITIIKLNKSALARFNKIVAIVVIIKAYLFSLFKEKYIKEFVKVIFSNIYLPFSLALISSSLLNEIYIDIKKEIIVKLVNVKKFYFIFDESTNINSNYIINLFIAIP